MKATINIREILEEKFGETPTVPATIDIGEVIQFMDADEEHELDVHDLLAGRKAIALIWEAEQLLSHYPHLTEDQAWDALQFCEAQYTAETGLTWDDVAGVVNERFPDAAEAKLRLLDRLQTLRRQVESLPADERTNPAAYGEIAAEIDAAENLVREKGWRA
jgi:hypothetical protein